MFRTLRNDAVYRQGRQILTSEGRPVKTTDHRIMRAIGKKTAFGVQVMHTSWMMHEYNALECLHQAGGAVPLPVAASENAILMSYHGDAQMAAPTLNTVRLDQGEAVLLFREVLRNVELMLQHDLIHGDLSAYNMLLWENELTIIDFPQAASSCGNTEAYRILRRDIDRVCDYFRRQRVRCDPPAIVDDLWSRYPGVKGSDRAADLSTLEALSLE
jgi:RIO kinase 1